MSDINVDPVFQYPSNAMDVAGLDLSLTATGIATRKGTRTLKPKQLAGPLRLIWLRDAILHAIRQPMLAVIEGYSYASPNQGPQMGELGGIVRVALHEAGIPFVVVAPRSVKKYATGKGTSTKGQVLAAAIQRSGESFDGDDNQADAFWLRQMGVAHYHGETDMHMPQVNREVLDRIEWPEL